MRPETGLSAIYYLIAAALAVVLLASAQRASIDADRLARFASAQEKTDTLVKELAEKLTLGLYTGASDKERVIAALRARIDLQRGRVRACAWALGLLSVAFLALRLWRARGVAPALAVHLLGVATVCLPVGLLAPILTITAHQQMAVLGTVVLQHQTKSVISTGLDLARDGDLSTAALLFAFSVAIPVLKLAASFAAVAAPSPSLRRRLLSVIVHVGKWSMTDVFVVAVLLAFLSTRGRALTDAALGPGLYFFAAYGVLSLLAVQLLARRVASVDPPG